MGSVPARIERVVRDYRAQLEDLEAAYTRSVGAERAAARRRLRDAVGRFVAQLRAAGIPENVTRRWVTDHAAYRELLAAARADLDRITVEAVRAIQWQIAAAAQLGPEAANELVLATLNATPAQASIIAPTFGQVPTAAVRELVGQLQAGSPLANLPRLNAEAVEAMGRELVRGLVSGTNSRTIGNRLAAISDIPAARARTIARTETHRAYREANRAAFQRNPMVGSWIWHAEVSVRTCSACMSMHGSEHSNDEPMGTHPNCRCVQLPKVDPPAWMDAPDVEYPQGEDVFAGMSAEDQRAILGPQKHAAYTSGEITLGDTVKVRETREWGVTRSTASYSDAIAASG